MKQSKYDVPTPILLAQAEVTLRQMENPVLQPRYQSFKTAGIGPEFLDDFKAATAHLMEVENAQERLKAQISVEGEEDQAAAEAGYRYKLALDARVRAYRAKHDDELGLHKIFRFGKLSRARVRSVTYELRIVIPEMERYQEKFVDVGIDDAFIQKGKDLLTTLEKERSESEALRDERKKVTEQVVAAELDISRLMSRLVAADEIICLEDIEAEPAFRLHVIATEVARAAAENEARRIKSTSRAFNAE